MIFKVRITQGYNDAELGRWVEAKEELPVSKDRAMTLLNARVAEIIDIEPEQGETLAPTVLEESTDYNELDDEALAALAAERQIDTTDKTRRQVINLLKKAE